MTVKKELLVLALIVLGLVLGQVEYAHRLYGGLSPMADPFSEANTVRAAEGFRAHGFRATDGLSEVNYGDKFPNDGYFGKAFPENGYDGHGPFIYTHYPPGPELILGALTMLLGPGHMDLYRLLPISIAAVAMLAFAYQLWLRLGFARALLLLLVCAAFPMFTNMMHGLHYQSYALSLVLVEIALLIRMMFRIESGQRIGLWDYAPLFPIGFVQGYLSFDHVFLVPLIPFAILAAARRIARPVIVSAVASMVLVGGGFAVAHAVHFAQVAAYDHSVSAAIQDFLASARYNAYQRFVIHSPIEAVLLYVFAYSSEPHGFNVSLIVFDIVILLLAGLVQARPGSGFSVGRMVAVELVSALAGLSWMLAMPAHAGAHVHFILRNLFIAYFAPALYLVRNLPLTWPGRAVA